MSKTDRKIKGKIYGLTAMCDTRKAASDLAKFYSKDRDTHIVLTVNGKFKSGSKTPPYYLYTRKKVKAVKKK